MYTLNCKRADATRFDLSQGSHQAKILKKTTCDNTKTLLRDVPFQKVTYRNREALFSKIKVGKIIKKELNCKGCLVNALNRIIDLRFVFA